MSGMLEQAIVDADALREAAVKNAETLVLEKYSDKIRGAVESLLEEEDPFALEDEGGDMGAEVDLGGAMTEEEDPDAKPEGASSVVEHIPFGATQDLDEEIEIPLDKLFEQISDLAQINEEEEEKEDEDVLSEIEDDLLETLAEGEACPSCGGKHGVNEECVNEETLDEELDEDSIQESILDALAEELMVDIEPVRSGWAGTPTAVFEVAEEEVLALEQDSQVREERAAIRKAAAALKKVNESLEARNKELTGSLTDARGYMIKLRDTVVALKEKLDTLSISNAKLLYTNKALESASLNERQKNKLVEAISNADTIEEAKVIFETLQNAVGSTSRKQQPKSLSEAVQKPSSMILAGRSNRSQSRKESPTFDRWKFLAGIDKN